jgi:hypothetical protein
MHAEAGDEAFDFRLLAVVAAQLPAVVFQILEVDGVGGERRGAGERAADFDNNAVAQLRGTDAGRAERGLAAEADDDGAEIELIGTERADGAAEFVCGIGVVAHQRLDAARAQHTVGIAQPVDFDVRDIGDERSEVRQIGIHGGAVHQYGLRPPTTNDCGLAAALTLVTTPRTSFSTFTRSALPVTPSSLARPRSFTVMPFAKAATPRLRSSSTVAAESS